MGGVVLRRRRRRRRGRWDGDAGRNGRRDGAVERDGAYLDDDARAAVFESFYAVDQSFGALGASDFRVELLINVYLKWVVLRATSFINQKQDSSVHFHFSFTLEFNITTRLID